MNAPHRQILLQSWLINTVVHWQLLCSERTFRRMFTARLHVWKCCIWFMSGRIMNSSGERLQETWATPRACGAWCRKFTDKTSVLLLMILVHFQGYVLKISSFLENYCTDVYSTLEGLAMMCYINDVLRCITLHLQESICLNYWLYNCLLMQARRCCPQHRQVMWTCCSSCLTVATQSMRLTSTVWLHCMRLVLLVGWNACSFSCCVVLMLVCQNCHLNSVLIIFCSIQIGC